MTYTASTHKVAIHRRENGQDNNLEMDTYDSPHKISTLMSYQNNAGTVSESNSGAVRSLLAIKKEEIKYLRHQLL